MRVWQCRLKGLNSKGEMSCHEGWQLLDKCTLHCVPEQPCSADKNGSVIKKGMVIVPRMTRFRVSSVLNDGIRRFIICRCHIDLRVSYLYHYLCRKSRWFGLP